MQRPWKVRNSSSNERAFIGLKLKRSPSLSSLNVYAHEDGDQTKPICTRLPDYNVDSVHLSCESDIFRGNSLRYGGIIIYSRNGESEWRTANGKHCKSGYIVIQDSASERVKKWSGEPGAVHGAVYRSAFGESVKDHEIIGEGFSIQNGELITTSGVFNAPPKSPYHDGKREKMSDLTERCVSEVVKDWKAAGRKYPPTLGTRNFVVRKIIFYCRRNYNVFCENFIDLTVKKE